MKVGQKKENKLNSIMIGERDLGEGSKERPNLLFSRERRNTIESEGGRFRKGSFGSPNLSRFKNFSLSSMMGERKASGSIWEEEGENKRERKSSLGSLGFFSGDKQSRCRSYRKRRGSVDCVERSRQRKTSLSSLGGIFGRERSENKESGLVRSHGSLPTCGRSSTRSSVVAPSPGGSQGSLMCSGGKSSSVREQRLWFSVQWPGLSVSLPEERRLRRAISEKGEAGITR